MNGQTGSKGWNPRPIHRILGIVLLLFTLYLATTGSMMQLIDLRAILSHAPGTDKEMVQIREGINGPSNFVVIQPTDYEAAPLPANLDLNAALARTLQGARTALGESAALKFVDLRVEEGKPVGLVRAGDQTLRFDASSGGKLPSLGRPADPGDSAHLRWKVRHTLRGSGNWVMLMHVAVGLGLFTMTATGLVLYLRLLAARRKAGRGGLFWSSGGVWRSLHRAISVLAAVFLLVISLTGTMLGIDGLGTGIYRATHANAGKYRLFPAGAIADFSSPLPDAKLPAMLQTTLSAAAHTADNGLPIKAVRLRYFNGIPQGVVIAGSGNSTQQLIFNAETGRRMGITEPEYPKTHYHLGWQEHEWMKKIHRGDAFGVSGRVMDMFAGLSLIYLSISGGVMYFDLWRKRRRGGRTALFWT